MVDAQAGVARPGVSKRFPERVNALVGVQGAEGVGPALRDEAVECGAHLWAEESIAEPALGRINIKLGRHDVVIAGEDDLRIGR